MENLVLNMFCSITSFKKMINYGDISKKPDCVLGYGGSETSLNTVVCENVKVYYMNQYIKFILKFS